MSAARTYDGPALFSYGFRPFFLLGSIYAGLAILVWLPVFMGELALVSAFVPRDWHVHEMLYGFLPAVITGFLFTAIPNWTGRLPLQGTSADVSRRRSGRGPRCGDVFGRDWLACAPCWSTAASCCWSPPRRPARSLPARKWNNLKVVALVARAARRQRRIPSRGAFRRRGRYTASASASRVVVLLISLIGGRIIPSFTRNWLVKENPGRLPVPFARFACCRWPSARWRSSHGSYRRNLVDRLRAGACRRAAPGPACALGRRPHGRERLLLILHVGYAFVPIGFLLQRLQRLRHRAAGRRRPCLDGRRRGRHDAGGDEPGFVGPHRSTIDRIGRHPGNLRCDRRGRLGAHLRGPRAGARRAAAARRSVRLGGGFSRLRGLLRPFAGWLPEDPGENGCGGVMESRRATLVDDISRETGITDAMIADVVETFYGRVRQDPLLAPVFARVEDWNGHLAKLRAFWSSVVLMSGRYHGQPMQAHFPLSIEPLHFDRWLALFEQATTDVCSPAAAAVFMEKARRIADSFEMAIAGRRGEIVGPRHSKSPPTLQRS